MEFYSYVNIFETKGLEYLLLLSFLVLFVLLVKYLAEPGKKIAATNDEELPEAAHKRQTAGR